MRLPHTIAVAKREQHTEEGLRSWYVNCVIFVCSHTPYMVVEDEVVFMFFCVAVLLF